MEKLIAELQERAKSGWLHVCAVRSDKGSDGFAIAIVIDGYYSDRVYDSEDLAKHWGERLGLPVIKLGDSLYPPGHGSKG